MKKLILFLSITLLFSFGAVAQHIGGGAGDTVGVAGTFTGYFTFSGPDYQVYSIQAVIDSVNGTPVDTTFFYYSNDKTNWTVFDTVVSAGTSATTTDYVTETTGMLYKYIKVYSAGSGGRSTVEYFMKTFNK